MKILTLAFVFATTGMQAQNVGIGTNTPISPLTVISNENGKGVIQKSGSTEIGFFVSEGNAFIQTYSNHNLHFSTSNKNPMMTLTTSGNLGIGVTTPTKKLQVSGDAQISGTLQAGVTNVVSLTIGTNGTETGVLQHGTHMAGASGSGQLVTTITFPKSFGGAPRFTANVRHDPSYNSSDAFSITIKSITHSQVVLLIKRIDTNTAWAQNLRIDWIAIQ